MNAMKTICSASLSSSRAYPAVARSMVTDAIRCPECGRPVRLKLLGSPKFPGRYTGIPRHTRGVA